MFLYPLWVRLWHILNAVLILILIFTGIRIFSLTRESSAILIEHAGVVDWHNVVSKILVISYLGFLVGNIFTDNGKYYKIERKNFFSNLVKQIRFNINGMFKHEKQPFPPTLERKFNPLQKLTYIVIMYITLPLIIISGIGLMIPEETIEKLIGSDGLVVIDVLHIFTGILISVFLILHIYLATIGYRPSTGLRGIITGYVQSDED